MRPNEKLILASSSPRRAALLKLIGIPFEVVPSDLQEEVLLSDPSQHVLRLSEKKAEDVARSVRQGLVLGADTIVVADGQILGKPRDADDARSMLGLLSGRDHQVFTGLTLLDASSGRRLSDFVATVVRMRPLSDQQIEWYLSTGEPMDKAGAYGIQGKGAVLIDHIEGCYYNVVGLPLAKLTEMLDAVGYPYWAQHAARPKGR